MKVLLIIMFAMLLVGCKSPSPEPVDTSFSGTEEWQTGGVR